jgi:hypothetical protein
MKIVTIVVDVCRECPYFQYLNEDTCNHYKTRGAFVIDRDAPPPEGCPLPDAIHSFSSAQPPY